MELILEKKPPVALVSINRPERSNSLTNEVLDNLRNTVTELEGDESIRAVVVTGSGGLFSSGFDLTAMSSAAAEDPTIRRRQILDHANIAGDTFWRIWRSPLPFVAAVERMCLGGAVYLTGVFDFVLVTPDVEMGMVELKMGLAPPMFNIFPWMMSYRGAKEFLLTGDVVDGARAVELGLANRCVAADDLLNEAMALAHRLSDMPDDVVAKMKRAVNRRWEVAGLVTEVEHGLDAYVHDKADMRPFQREFRQWVTEVGVEAAIGRLGIQIGLREPYIGQK